MKMPKDVMRHPDGEPMLVLRPRRPAETVALARIAVAHQSDEAFRQAITGQECVFRGFLVKRAGKMIIVDEDGLNPEAIMAGDIIAGPEDLHQPS